VQELFRGLGLSPLRPAPVRARSFFHASYSAATHVLLQATGFGEGFVVLTGAAGTGKTTLLGDLSARLQRDGYCVGMVANAQVDADNLLQLVGFAFGLQADHYSRAGLLATLKDRLPAKGPTGKPAILIIDEAQDLAPAALEDLRLLSDLTVGSGPLVQIILAGRDRIWDLLDRPDHMRIRQRIRASCRLNPLSLDEARSYIGHARELAGFTGDPAIGADALRLIHERTGGVPRLLGLTLGHLLLHGNLVEARVLDVQDVESVLAHLEKDHPELIADTSGQRALSQPAVAQPLLHPMAPAPPLPEADSGGLPQLIPAAPTAHRDDAGKWALSEGFRRLAGWPWKWLLPGLSAAAIAWGLLVFDSDSTSVEGDRSEPPTTTERHRGQESPIGATDSMGPIAAAPGGAPSKQPLSPAPPAADPQHRAPPTDGSGADRLRRDPVEQETEILGSESTPDGPKGSDADLSLSEAPAKSPPESRAEIERNPAGIAESTPTEGSKSGDQDRPIPASPEVTALLAQAERALAQNRLTAPVNDNAYAHYRTVLALDPANAEARAGLQRIVHQYRQLARQRLTKGDLSGARRFASRGLTIEPRDRQLLTIKRQAASRAAQAARPRAARPRHEDPDLFSRIERWFRSGKSDNSPFLDH
jgi:type II secretory pathway predicted ATPase ExeA